MSVIPTECTECYVTVILYSLSQSNLMTALKIGIIFLTFFLMEFGGVMQLVYVYTCK